MPNYGVTFNLGSAKVFLSAIFETDFSSHKDLWIAANRLLNGLLNNCYYLLYLLLLFFH